MSHFPPSAAALPSRPSSKHDPVALVAGRYVMVLAAAFEEWREKRRLEQIARAVRGADAEWEAWLQRQMQAKQRGEPFDEPTPSARRRAAESAQQQ